MGGNIRKSLFRERIYSVHIMRTPLASLAIQLVLLASSALGASVARDESQLVGRQTTDRYVFAHFMASHFFCG